MRVRAQECQEVLLLAHVQVHVLVLVLVLVLTVCLPSGSRFRHSNRTYQPGQDRPSVSAISYFLPTFPCILKNAAQHRANSSSGVVFSQVLLANHNFSCYFACSSNKEIYGSPSLLLTIVPCFVGQESLLFSS